MDQTRPSRAPVLPDPEPEIRPVSILDDATAASLASDDLRPTLPAPRGPLTSFLLEHLTRPPHKLPVASGDVSDVMSDDLQLALYVCYELHYRSFAGVDERWEWEPSLLEFRRRLEDAFEQWLRDQVATPPPGRIEAQLWEMVNGDDGPSLSQYIADRGTLAEVRELAVHRSAYQLKEADPHTWAIPRLAGGPKAAMVEIQCDEYGMGVASEMHASLWADTMDALGLDRRYGAYLDWLPGATLATVNVISFFGLHRRWRGALVGHLAVFEMTSVGPMGRYAEALRRLGFGADARRFYEVHVEADAHHQHVAADRLAGRLAAEEPALAGDILFGAAAVMTVERRFTEHILNAWSEGRSSLRRPLRRE